MGEERRLNPARLPQRQEAAPFASDAPAIEVKGLKKTFGYRKPIHALKGVSLKVERGEVFGLLGPNGAGKTTLIKILLGICRSSGGEAHLLGEPVPCVRTKRWVGYLPENHRFPRHHTARTLLDYYLRLEGLAPKKWRQDRDTILELVGLGQAADRRIAGFSKGMLQRLGLAQAILHGPEVVFLDEPTDGVDPMGRRDIRDLIVELKKRGRTLFLNSHILSEIEQVCDRVAILNQGELVHVGTVQDLTATNNEYHLTIARPDGGADIEATLKPHVVFARPEGAAWRIGVEAAAGLDGVVDALRQAGLGLRGLVPLRTTLEERFIDMLADHEAEGGGA